MIIFGYHLANIYRIPINVLIIIDKKYIPVYDTTLSNINLKF